MGKPGYIYFLQSLDDDKLIKIGKTKRDPNERIAEYDKLLPFETRIMHAFECEDIDASEAFMHDMFGDLRLRGEWFRVMRQDVTDILNGVYDAAGTTALCVPG